MTDDHWVLHRIWQSREPLERNLARAERGVSTYCSLQADLQRLDVSAALEYQKKYVTFYGMFRQKRLWLDSYFALLESEKGNTGLSFGEVLGPLSTQRTEASFSSKLVATVRPDMPVIDQYVLANLGLRPPPRSTGDGRRDAWVQLHSSLSDLYLSLLEQNLYLRIAEHFRDWFAKYPSLTDVKKLDILLWQLR